MLYAKNENNVLIHASKANKNERYFCTCCSKPVVLKQGHYKRAHFAHEVLHDCFNFSIKKESSEHLFCKQFIYQLLNEGDCHLEYYMHEIEQIPDVFLLPNIIFEVQLSVISTEMIYMRTKGFHALGHRVFWVVDRASLHFKGQTVKLNAFQHAMIEPHLFCLFCFDFKHQALYALMFTECVKLNTYRYQKIIIHSKSDVLKILKSANRLYKKHIHRLSQSEKRKYIKQCKQKKSVLEPTLSALYQMRMSHELPEIIGVVLPLQIYIRAHPIAWQTQLLKGLKFNERIDYRKLLQIQSHMLYGITEEEVINDLLKSYFGILKEIRANMLEK